MPTLQIGPLALPLPELLVMLGLWFGLNLAEKYADKFGVRAEQIFPMAMWGLGIGILGARLSYIARYPTAFQQNWMDIFSRNPGLFDPVGGIALGGIAIAIYAQQKKVHLAAILDTFTPALLVLLIALPLSDLASGRAFGYPTTMPWAIELWGKPRHPTQIYALIAAGLVLLMLWPAKKFNSTTPKGSYFLQFATLSSFAALFVEAFRGDSLLILNGFRQNQLVAWVILAISLIGLFLTRRYHTTVPDSQMEA